VSERRRVVVIGAGFGGLAACESLAKVDVDVVLVDRHNYNTFQPLLYQVATAGLDPGDIAYPVRGYAHGRPRFRFRQDVVTAVDIGGRSVSFAEGPALTYDYLVLAAGAGTSYFGVAGAETHARAIYTMEDAIAVRNIVTSSLERAASHGERDGELTVLIVGGGPTGVEMAGTLAELRAMQFATQYPELDPACSRIVLVELQDRLLSAFHPKLGAYARKALTTRGVEVRCGESVQEVHADRAVLGSGEVVPCGLVIWAAGVGSCALTEVLDLEKVHGRVKIRSDLRVVGRDEVFAIGDMAALSDGEGDQLLPQLAPPAIQEGSHVGRQIGRLLAGEAMVAFAYKDKGIMATIGRNAAVAELAHGVRLRGIVAWFAWLGLHIVLLLGARNRASVLLNWAWRYVSWRSGSRVIAGG
jgi:NADH dehydrogenase